MPDSCCATRMKATTANGKDSVESMTNSRTVIASLLSAGVLESFPSRGASATSEDGSPNLRRDRAASFCLSLNSSQIGDSCKCFADNPTCTIPIHAGNANKYKPQPVEVVKGLAKRLTKKIPSTTPPWKNAPRKPRKSRGDISIK